MKPGILSLLSLLALTPTSLSSQAVTIAVEITDPTGGMITDAFTAALQGLPDVGVVPEAERPRYVLRGVALCQPDTEDCGQATSFILALALVEPLNPVLLADLVSSADPSLRIQTDSAYRTEVWDITAEYMKIHRFSATNVGRGAYDRAIQGFVETLDARCFTKTRILGRWMLARQEGRTEEAAAFSEELDGGDWIC